MENDESKEVKPQDDEDEDKIKAEEEERDISPSRRSGKSSPRKKTSKSPKRKNRANKIYRTPVTPEPEELLFREKSFVLDCMATSSISRDYSKVNPKLGPVIPPYSPRRDTHSSNYFNYFGVQKTLKKTGQDSPEAPSMEGIAADKFHKFGAGANYLKLRNQFGAGHSQETIDGHTQFMQGIREVIGYNGKYGFKRNTPWLRKHPTPFEPATIVPTQ